MTQQFLTLIVVLPDVKHQVREDAVCNVGLASNSSAPRVQHRVVKREALPLVRLCVVFRLIHPAISVLIKFLDALLEYPEEELAWTLHVLEYQVQRGLFHVVLLGQLGALLWPTLILTSECQSES